MSISPRRDLRTGQSVWQARREAPIPHQPLHRDHRTEVIVVGAGITGAMLADRLSADGHRVLIVDRRPPVAGSTPASTALIQYDLDLPLTKLAEEIGWQRATRIWRRSSMAVDTLGRRIERLGLDAVTWPRTSLYLDGNVLGRRDLRREGTARMRIGLETEYLEPAEVARTYGISGRAALRSPGSLATDPRRLASALLRLAVRRGASILSPVEVTDVESGRGGVVAHTTEGWTLRARHLVFATGYEVPRVVPKGSHKVQSTWALATIQQPTRLWADQAFIWEAADPYLYMRTTADGRVVCGGEDEPFADDESRDALLPAKIATLERKLSRLLPRLDTRAAFAWCGSFGSSHLGTPSIGPVPGLPHCHAVLGFGGNGITFAALAAQAITSTIAGVTDPDLELFAFAARGRRRK